MGSYYVSLRGEVDALVFAGGIGEKSSQLRSAVTGELGCLGFSLDSGANSQKMSRIVQDISGPDARHKVLVCQVDEQLEMARLCSQSAST